MSRRSTFERIWASTAESVQHRVWIMSDLQQSELTVARQCLTEAITDFQLLDMACEQIWYLGDSVQGADLDVVKQMADMQAELLQSLGIPLTFVCGNHEFDPYWCQQDNLPLPSSEALEIASRERFMQVPDWRTSERLSDFYFKGTLGDYALFFFPDHAQPQGSWIASGGKIHGDKEAYPYTIESYKAVTEEIRSIPGPVITAAHNSFAGGLRASPVLNQMLPLPGNVRAHFYGHSHIGEAYWGGPSCFRKLSTVDTQNIPQIDVAALENHRGDAIRSTILEIYKDGTFGVFLREHCRRRWSDAYYLAESLIDD
ncbi:MAG: metallophosphoesterase [Lentisphaeria bacterium]|nr:metallophosphoesterase [Lentisphaeria bacterium]